MRIDRLELSNFRCFASREFSFHPQFNCITGANASGKTALLDALAAPLREWINGLVAPEEFWLRGEKDDIRLDYSIRAGVDVYQPQYPTHVRAYGEVGGRSFRSVTNLGDRTQAKSLPDDERPWLGDVAREVQQMAQSREATTLSCIAYYTTRRLAAAGVRPEAVEPMEPADLALTEGYESAMAATIPLERLRSWLDRQARIHFEEGQEPTLSVVVREAMRDMLDGALEVAYSSRALDVVVRFADRGRWPLRQLSDGQRNLLALAGDLAVRMARLNPHLAHDAVRETPGVVLIDELDLHLHPEWQRTVVGNLKRTFPKVQFFVTTHSPFIVQGLDDWEHLPLEGEPIQNTGKLGIEEIARGLMGVERPDVGQRYEAMLENAKDYLRLLGEAEKAPEEKLAAYKELLAQRLAPYADNPAYQAFLELERVSRLGS